MASSIPDYTHLVSTMRGMGMKPAEIARVLTSLNAAHTINHYLGQPYIPGGTTGTYTGGGGAGSPGGSGSSGFTWSGSVQSQPPLQTKDNNANVVKISELQKGDEIEVVASGCCGPTATQNGVVVDTSYVSCRQGHSDCSGITYEFEGGEVNMVCCVQKHVKKKAKAPIKPIKLDDKIFEKLVLPADQKQEIYSVLKQHEKAKKLFEEWGLGETIEYGKGMTFLFYGPPGTGKTWAANCIAKAMGHELVVVSPSQIQSSEPGGANRAIEEAFAKAKGKNKILFFDECDGLTSDRTYLGAILASEVNTLLTEIEKYEGILILATNRAENLDAALERRISLMLEFREPKYDQRLEIWKTLTPSKLPLGKDVTLEKLAENKLTGGQIKNALLSAARLAIAEDGDKVDIGHFEQAISRIHASRDVLGTDDVTKRALGITSKKTSTDKAMDKVRSMDKVTDVEVVKD